MSNIITNVLAWLLERMGYATGGYTCGPTPQIVRARKGVVAPAEKWVHVDDLSRELASWGCVLPERAKDFAIVEVPYGERGVLHIHVVRPGDEDKSLFHKWTLQMHEARQ